MQAQVGFDDSRVSCTCARRKKCRGGTAPVEKIYLKYRTDGPTIIDKIFLPEPARKGCNLSEPLATYLHDHLGGAEHAIDLVRHLRDEHPGDALGEFASEILLEIEADRQTLRDLCERLDSKPDHWKEAAGWLMEKTQPYEAQNSGARFTRDI